MKKISLIILFICIVCALSVILGACSANRSSSADYAAYESGASDYSGSNEVAKADAPISDVQDRIIIYTADVYLYVDDVDKASGELKAMLNGDEWISSSSVSDGYASFVLRIKTGRLDAFLSSLSDVGQINRSSVRSDDVSLNYYDNTARKTTLLNEQARLNTLLGSAETVQDTLTITKRLSEIDTELAIINRTLNNYDSLVEYSTVNVDIRTEYASEKETFGSKLKDAYAEGWEFAKDLIIFVLAALPFLIVIAGIVVLIVYLNKRIKAKRVAKNNAEIYPAKNKDDQNNN